MVSRPNHCSVAVLLPGRPDDGGWAQSAAEAVEALRADPRRVALVPQPQFEPGLALPAAEEQARSGIDLIIGHGHEYIEAFFLLAEAYPGTYFFAMDNLARDGAWPPNLCCLYQRQDEGAFLCGRLSAHMTKTGIVGFVGGIQVPTQTANGRAFEQGVRSFDPSIDVKLEYADSFEDPLRGRVLAFELLDQGTDVIMHTASETGNGVIEACEARGAFIIGYTLDQGHMAPRWMLTSLIVDVTQIFRHKIHEAESGQFRAGVWTVGLAEEIIGLAPLSRAVPESVAADLNEVKQAIIEGTIDV